MNTFGNKFRISIFGESHGPLIGVTVDGVLPGIPLGVEDFSEDLKRRKAGALGTTPRIEADVPEIVSGVCNGRTTGAPLTLLFKNENTRSEDYEQFRRHPRPGQADFTSNLKFGGFNDIRGGGHFSGRVTLGVVAAGVIAKKMLYFVNFYSRLTEVGGLREPASWADALRSAAAEGDSLGGVVECVVEGLPIGLGEPFWDSVESLVSHAVFAIPGVRGIEFGDGFAAARMKGSEHNDPFPEQGCCHGDGGHGLGDAPEHLCGHGDAPEHGCGCHGEGGESHGHGDSPDHACCHGEHEEGHGCHHDGSPDHACCHGEHEEGHDCHHNGSPDHACCHGEHEEGHDCHHNGSPDHACCHGEHEEGHDCHHDEDGGHHCCGRHKRPQPPVTNHAGGVNGGITNGNALVFRVAFKPTSSIAKAGIPGRHDVCFALRCPVIVEAMTAIVLADLAL